MPDSVSRRSSAVAMSLNLRYGHADPVQALRRACASARERERARWSSAGVARRRRLAGAALGDEPAGLLYAVEQRVRGTESRDRRGRRGGADPARLGRCVSAFGGADRPSCRRRRGGGRAGGRDRDLHRHDACDVARPAGASTSSTRRTRGWPSGDGRHRRRRSRRAYDLCEVAIAHRVGGVSIGETSVAIAVSAPHRADALAACKDAIDRLKETVPLWKKEIYEGGEEWIGRGS